MTEIMRLWSAELPEIPARELDAVRRAVSAELYEVCACFWLFRRLHRLEEPTALLTGDFCFGRFSVHLSELDSEELCDAFSAYLMRDAADAADISEYLAFIGALPSVDKSTRAALRQGSAPEKSSARRSFARDLPPTADGTGIRELIASGPGAAFCAELFCALDRMESELSEMCRDSGALEAPLRRFVSGGGKRLRPLLAWTAWSIGGRKMPVLELMCMIEAMHTASLIHDDVVDRAPERRGSPTLNAALGALPAIAGGDFLLGRSMEKLHVYRGTGINESLSRVSLEMCLGELDQRAGLFETRGLSREAYLLRAKRKTALLMSESCRCGAAAGGADEKVRAALASYGLHLGLAFQMRDDIADLSPGSGKAPMQDLRCGVMSLLAVCALESGSAELEELLRRRDKLEGDMDRILGIMKKNGTFDSARAALRGECRAAKAALEALAPSAQVRSLGLLAEKLSEVEINV